MVTRARMVKKSKTKKAARKVHKAKRRPLGIPPAIVLAAADVPAPGQPWPDQGGIYAGILAGIEGKPNYHLVLVTGKDGKPVVIDSGHWGEYGQEIPNCGSVDDGLANTEAMLKAGNALAKKVLAACSDGYLGAIREVQLVFANARKHLPREWFWTSTQSSSSYAWGQYFGSGTTDHWDKGNTDRAFVVRRVLIK